MQTPFKSANLFKPTFFVLCCPRWREALASCLLLPGFQPRIVPAVIQAGSLVIDSTSREARAITGLALSALHCPSSQPKQAIHAQNKG